MISARKGMEYELMSMVHSLSMSNDDKIDHFHPLQFFFLAKILEANSVICVVPRGVWTLVLIGVDDRWEYDGLTIITKAQRNL